MTRQEPKLRFVFYVKSDDGLQIKSRGEVQVALESYMDKKGVLSYEANFCDFAENGIDTFRKAKTLAQFQQWKYKVPLDDLKRYCSHKMLDVTIKVESNTWRVILMHTPTRVNTSSQHDDLETAFTNAVMEMEANVNKQEQQIKRIQKSSYWMGQ